MSKKVTGIKKTKLSPGAWDNREVMSFEELINLLERGNRPHITTDSRKVKPGSIFVAVKGTCFDGHDYIEQAASAGAESIVCGNDKAGSFYLPGKRIIPVADTSRAAAILAQEVKDRPASRITNLGVTGTNGKTTVTYLVRSCIHRAGESCGLIGTINYDTGSTCVPASLTTPDCFEIADIQGQMVRAGTGIMIMEASSHAIDQNRLAGIDFKAAAFTNLAGDHLDYHRTKENYLAAKARLFRELSPDSVAVLNSDSPEAAGIAEVTPAHILWYGIDRDNENRPGRAELRARITRMDVTGTEFVLEYRGRNRKVTTPLIGIYNVSNHLAAAGLCLAAGYAFETIAAGLSELINIPGRLERIDRESSQAGRASESPSGKFSVLIDYAHSDDALRNVLSTLKPLCNARLVVVFGCGGDRDRSKRPRMAGVAQKYADYIVVTSDNPRTEEPGEIIKEILAGFDGVNSRQLRIEPDRRKAIGFAIQSARKDDVVLIAGKGHEEYQIIGSEKIEFSDREEAIRCLQKL